MLLLLPLALALLSSVSAVTIYTPPQSYKIPRVLYARTALLSDHSILATWEDYGPEPPSFPIYRSVDNGTSWTFVSRVKDQVNGWGLRYQPFLYELPDDFAGYPKGSILLAGSAIPEDLAKTQLDIYISTDGAKTFKFLSHVARGGKALPNNGLTPVWEPFLLLYKGKLIYYYSDQRDPKHGQKLVHQKTTDLKHWEPLVDDTAWAKYDARPGMTTIALLPNGQWIITYEVCGVIREGCPTYFRLSSDPTNFDSAREIKLVDQDGKTPNGSPYVVWTPAGGDDGTILVSTSSHSELYLNKELGRGRWQRVKTESPAAYTRSLLVLDDNKTILIVGAGVLNGKNNKVLAHKFVVR